MQMSFFFLSNTAYEKELNHYLFLIICLEYLDGFDL
jgi:hypothetical protein